MSDDLGLGRNIRRRDFLQATVATGMTPLFAQAKAPSKPTNYPPGKTGLRGSHEGSFETAHQLAREGRKTWPAAGSEEQYDLIVVGGGVSGLSAAYYYRQQQPDARILILDNHDDFGGHAKRNEFSVNGHHLIGYGGSQTMEQPSDYSDIAKHLLRSLQVDLDGFDAAFDQGFYARHGLETKIYFDKKTWGQSALVGSGALLNSPMLETADTDIPIADLINQTPLNANEKLELTNLVQERSDSLPDIGLTEVASYLSSISYETFLKQHGGITSERLINFMRPLPAGYFGVGNDATSALNAMLFGLPGLNKSGIPGAQWLSRKMASWMLEPYIHHYPDGNATIARCLVRTLIPEITSAIGANAVVRAMFDYSKLDRNEHNVRIRLSSTAIHAENNQGGAKVTYIRDGQRYTAQSKHTVLACYNMMIPHLCPELPQQQKTALASLVKVPLVYSNVALTNWRALKAAQVGMALTPSAFHNYFMVDFPVSLGGYEYTKSPDDPIVLHFSKTMTAPGLAPRDQHRIGRANLLATPFATMEKDLRQSLANVLGPSGFDPAQDIAAITVNRWPHGYAYSYNPLFDPDHAPGQAPHEIGRKTCGNIAIANSDAGARAYLDEAINQGYRAIGELLGG